MRKLRGEPIKMKDVFVYWRVLLLMHLMFKFFIEMQVLRVVTIIVKNNVLFSQCCVCRTTYQHFFGKFL